MQVEYKILWVGFQAEGMGAKVRLRVAKNGARKLGKDWSTEDGELHLVDICVLFSFISILGLNLLKKDDWSMFSIQLLLYFS